MVQTANADRRRPRRTVRLPFAGRRSCSRSNSGRCRPCPIAPGPACCCALARRRLASRPDSLSRRCCRRSRTGRTRSTSTPMPTSPTRFTRRRSWRRRRPSRSWPHCSTRIAIWAAIGWPLLSQQRHSLHRRTGLDWQPVGQDLSDRRLRRRAAFRRRFRVRFAGRLCFDAGGGVPDRPDDLRVRGHAGMTTDYLWRGFASRRFTCPCCPARNADVPVARMGADAVRPGGRGEARRDC